MAFKRCAKGIYLRYVKGMLKARTQPIKLCLEVCSGNIAWQVKKEHSIIQTSITMKQNHWAYVVFVERDRSWLYVCNMPFPMSETFGQKRQHYFEEVNSFLQYTCHTENMKERLNCSKGRVVSFHILIYCCKNTASYLREYLVFLAIALKKWNLPPRNK